MKVSVCVTVKNEEKTISDLVMSLLSQTKKPDEIIIVDGGSKDKTVEIIKHYIKKAPQIKLITEKVSRARGRNIAVSKSSHDIIAVTDAGCTPHDDWLEKITEPFTKSKVDVVAGFYDMKANSDMEKALSRFLGVNSSKFNSSFVPSARSMAFRKLTFEKLSGFPELMNDTAEDSLFCVNILRQGIKIHRVRGAIVDWRMPRTLKEAYWKFYTYALGDARGGVWYHPIHGILSHNFKAFMKILRYAILLFLAILASVKVFFLWLLLSLLVVYFYWAFSKVYTEFKSIKIGFWGIVIQLMSDVAVIVGFIRGTLNI